MSKYRPDIDGLRAIAVVSVILFHLHVVGLTGGYVGVDVFFVISGYLITGLIYEEIKSNTFSLKVFYLRRIRRIAPALIVTLIATAAVAFTVLRPEEMRSFGKSLALQILSVQNFFFLSEGEYFVGGDLKPLLHTWSLAVEEQFYLFWPLLLLLLVKRSMAFQLVVLFAILIASFAVNMVLMGISPKASFFLLPPRAWELGVGGLIAIAEKKEQFRLILTHGRRTIIGLLGIAMLVYSLFGLTEKTPFPGVAAIYPVVASAFLLMSGIGSPTALSTALGSKPLVSIGLISYPMYLWHWPIISLSRQFDIDPGQPLNAVLVVTATVALSVLTYKYVEQPIRVRKWMPQPRSLITSAALAFGVLVAVGGHLWLSDGASYRYPPVARNMLTAPFNARTERCGFVFRAINPKDVACTMVKSNGASRKVLLWGNSHADQWSGLFEDLSHEYKTSFDLSARNCRATVDSDFCNKRIQDSMMQYIESNRITDVVLASTGYGAYDIKDDLYEEQMKIVVKRLEKSGVRIWLVLDNPASPSLSPIVAYEKNPSNPKIGSLPASEYSVVKNRELELFRSLSAGSAAVKIIDTSSSLCNVDVCPGGKGDVVWYRDDTHLSNAGAKVAREHFLPVFEGR